MKKYALGVDIGGTAVKIGLFRSNGDFVESWEIPTRTEEEGRHILADIAESIQLHLQKSKISTLDIEGIGMGVPGPAGADGTVYKCVNLGWGVFNVEQVMYGLTGLKVKVGNDANVAALGEMWQGGGKGYKNIVMVTLGTGVGGGVIVNGSILSGTNGAAGEIGHIPMFDDETESCGCGKKGCLEQYGSATGIVRTAKKYLEANPGISSELRNLDDVTCKDIFDAAKRNDPAALSVLDRTAGILGKGLAMISCVVDCEVFVIGGGVSKAGTILIDAVAKHYQEYAFHASRGTRLELATLGNNAGIYGGAKLVL